MSPACCCRARQGRRREIAIRSAIGADRVRLVRQFLTESLVLAFTGAAIGLALAFGCVRAASSFISTCTCRSPATFTSMLAWLRRWSDFPSCRQCSSDWFRRCRHARAPAQEALREGTPSAGASRRQKYFRDALVVGEIALSLLLLISAGLLLRSLLALRNVPLGFVPHNVVTTAIFLPQASGGMLGSGGKYAGKDISQVFYHAVARSAVASSRSRLRGDNDDPAVVAQLPGQRLI